MATLTKGRYTYGSQTYANIILITGANIGDTVWDTTNNKRRVWDGNNFVNMCQKTVITTTGLQDGMVLTSSSTVDNRVAFQNLTGDTEVIIGIAESGKAGVTGAAVPVTYHGDVRALVIATVGNPAAPADYVRNDTTTVGNANTTGAGVGTFAHYLDANATATGVRRILFRPVERN